MDETEIKRHWAALGKELRKRTVIPFFHPSFVIFFIVAIVGVGAMGFWIELFNYLTANSPAGVPAVSMRPLRSSLASFIPAFIAATCMQLIWAEGDKKSLRAFAILVLAICILGSLFCGSPMKNDQLTMIVGAITSLIALWTWWIANANQKEFLDKDNDFMDAIGGKDLNAPLAGNLAGFQTE